MSRGGAPHPRNAPVIEDINVFDSGYVSGASPVVIGGCGRSGTTLMRVMLDSHARICCGPESNLFLEKYVSFKKLVERFDVPIPEIHRLAGLSRCRGEFIERFFDEYARSAGKPRWAEKTPRNIDRLDLIFRAFPNVRFIHMVRDGRDVACSLRTHPRHKVVDGELVERGTWNPLDDCISRWTGAVAASRPHRSHPGYLEVRYEDLVLDTRAALGRVLDFIGEPWDEEMVRYHEIKTGSRDVARFPQNPEATHPVAEQSIGRWRRDLFPEDQSLFKEMAGEELVELGYESSGEW